MGKLLELVGMQMQGLADEEGGLRQGISGAMREDEFCLRKAAHRVADKIEQSVQVAAADLECLAVACRRSCFRALGHQDLVQRAAAASSWLFASIQPVPRALS